MAISIPRHAERPEVPRGRALVFVVGASVVLLLAGLLALSRSPLFGLRRLEVRGAEHRSAAQIRAMAHLVPGTNVVWLSPSSIVDRLTRDPWIAAATVTRSLPGTVRITVEERRPIAVLRRDGREVLVAGDGTLLGAPLGDPRLPHVGLPAGSPTALALPSDSGAVRLLTRLAPRIRHRVRQVDVTVAGTLSVRLSSGTIVDFGPAVDLEQKSMALRRLLAWARRTGTAFASISLMAPDAPAARLRP